MLLAERAQPLLRPAVGDDALDPRNRGADAGELRLRLPPAADHAEAGRTLGSEVPRRDAARRTGTKLAELVRVEHRNQLRSVGTEEEDGEARAVAETGVDLRARVAELEVGGGHDGQRTALQPQAITGPVLDPPRGHTTKARLDRLHGVGRRQELGDILLREIEGHLLEGPLQSCAALPLVDLGEFLS